MGSIAGHSRGTIETVYSNAVVVGSRSNVGGILGQVDTFFRQGGYTDGHASGDKVEQIEIYDWSGTLITTVTVTVDSDSDVIEFENISVVGDKIYIMAAELSEILNYQYKKPANVYVIDKSVTE